MGLALQPSGSPGVDSTTRVGLQNHHILLYKVGLGNALAGALTGGNRQTLLRRSRIGEELSGGCVQRSELAQLIMPLELNQFDFFVEVDGVQLLEHLVPVDLACHRSIGQATLRGVMPLEVSDGNIEALSLKWRSMRAQGIQALGIPISVGAAANLLLESEHVWRGSNISAWCFHGFELLVG